MCFGCIILRINNTYNNKNTWLQESMIRKTYVLGVLSALLLSGCAAKTHTLKETIVVTPDISAMEELKSISVEARDELRLLAKAQQSVAEKTLTADQHKQSFIQATYVPPGFEKTVDFMYAGQLEKAAKAISMVAGYTLLPSTGIPPTTNLWVNIKLENQPLNEALKEIGMQSGDIVRIEIHSSAKLMRLIYK